MHFYVARIDSGGPTHHLRNEKQLSGKAGKCAEKTLSGQSDEWGRLNVKR